MKTFLIACALVFVVVIPETHAAGFDRARLESLHQATKRFVDEGKHAGIITPDSMCRKRR
jgi:hypothetical protein